MTIEQTQPLAIVTGVGPGTGSALVRRFARGGYRVAMLARDRARLDALASEVPQATAVPCDVADAVALDQALTGIFDRLGIPKVVVHNAVSGAFGNFRDIEPEILQRNFDINVMALLHLARFAAPRMVEAGGGALIVTGNTSALRGKPNFAGFAPTKAAQRILAEIDRTRPRSARTSRGLSCHRCGDRCAVGACAIQGRGRRLLHQTRCNRG